MKDMVTGPEIEVRRSKRRRRTVSAYRDGDRIVVLIPASMSKRDERRGSPTWSPGWSAPRSDGGRPTSS